MEKAKKIHVWSYNLARTKCGKDEKFLRDNDEYYTTDDPHGVTCEECKRKWVKY